MTDDDIRVGMLIQHVSGSGEIFEVVKIREEYGDALAVTLAVDPSLTRVINPGNWKEVR